MLMVAGDSNLMIQRQRDQARTAKQLEDLLQNASEVQKFC